MITVTNKKFRSIAQAVGRVASTLQRFTSDKIKIAYISFQSSDLQVASYRVDLNKITYEQYNPKPSISKKSSILAVDLETTSYDYKKRRFFF